MRSSIPPSGSSLSVCRAYLNYCSTRSRTIPVPGLYRTSRILLSFHIGNLAPWICISSSVVLCRGTILPSSPPPPHWSYPARSLRLRQVTRRKEIIHAALHRCSLAILQQARLSSINSHEVARLLSLLHRVVVTSSRPRVCAINNPHPKIYSHR